MDRGAWQTTVHVVTRVRRDLATKAPPGTPKASQAALVVKNLCANAGDVKDLGLIPGLERSPGGGHDNPLQYSYLENPMDRGA